MNLQMTWDEAMKIFNELPKDQRQMVRQEAVDRLIIESEDDGIGTSDINYMITVLIKTDDYKVVIDEFDYSDVVIPSQTISA